MAEPRIPILHTALRGRCPRCVKDKLFKGLLPLQPACPVCGLSFGQSDTGDAGAMLLIMALGAFAVSMAFWVDFHLSPPLWVYAVLWPVVTIPLTVLFMRP